MVPIDLDIDMLRCFVEVAKIESFTKAGKNIGLTQSVVSVKIRRFEERLGAQIFKRTSKDLLLTLEGEVLLEYAKRILSVHDEAVSRLTKPKASGNLRIGLTDYFIPELLPNLLSKFRKQYPNINLEIQTGVGINLIPLFEKGELDLVVAGKDAYQGSSRVLTQEPLTWVVGKDTEASLHERIYSSENGRAIIPEPRQSVISPGWTTYPANTLSRKSFWNVFNAEAIAERGVAESFTSMGTSFAPAFTTISTSVPAVVRQK